MRKQPDGFGLRPVTDADYPDMVAVNNAIHPDHPDSEEHLRHNDQSREAKIQHARWAITDGQRSVGFCEFSQDSWIYHPQKFQFHIALFPAEQGRGFGAASFDHVMSQLAAFNPIKLMTWAHEPQTRAIRFLEERGFKITSREMQSSLDLTTYRPEDHAREISSVLGDQFRLVTLDCWREERDDADRLVWELDRDTSRDIPFTETIEAPDFETYREQVLGHPVFNAASWFILLDGDKAAAMTNLWKHEANAGINTGLTGVRREYRRRGLATALKHTALAWAKGRGYPWIRTENDSTNTGMLGINQRVGFKPMPAWLVFEKELTR